MPARPRTTLTPADASAAASLILARSRARYGNATMAAPPQTDPPKADDPPPADPPKADDPPKDEGPKFTQADLDRIVGERVAAEKTKAQKALEEAQQLAGKNETEKLTIERDQATQRATEATQKAAERVAKTEAKVAAIAAGANPERLTAIVRNADLAAAVKDGDVDEAAIKAAVDKVLTDYPEWKAKPGYTGPAASGGALDGKGSDKPTFTRAQLEAMSPDEMAKRIDEINEAIADGRVTG